MPEYRKPESKTYLRARIGTIWDTIPKIVSNYRRVARIETVSKFEGTSCKRRLRILRVNPLEIRCFEGASSEFEGASYTRRLRIF